jgi:hypothetical protein
MRIRTKYTSFDMLRFLSFSKKEENKDIKGIDLIKKYNEIYPELTSEQKLKNIKAALGLDFQTTEK